MTEWVLKNKYPIMFIGSVILGFMMRLGGFSLLLLVVSYGIACKLHLNQEGRLATLSVLAFTPGYFFTNYSDGTVALLWEAFQKAIHQEVEGPYYRGSASIVRRFLSIDLISFWYEPWLDLDHDTNLYTMLVKTELFGGGLLLGPRDMEPFDGKADGVFYAILAMPMLWLFVCMGFIAVVIGGYLCIQNKKRSILIPAIVGFAVPVVIYAIYPYSTVANTAFYPWITTLKALLLGYVWTCMKPEQRIRRRILQDMTITYCSLGFLLAFFSMVEA